MKNEKQSIKRIIKESYGKAAEQGCGCLCNGSQMDAKEISKSIGYSENEIEDIIEYVQGNSRLENVPWINRETLKAKGLSEQDLIKVESVLPSVFDMSFA